MLATAPAHAQATRTWVSGVGDDVNPCSRTAPCKTFPGAISKTAAGGEINCLDPAGYGTVTITKSISIICHHTLGGILSSGVNGVIVNVLSTDEVILKGLDINGANTGTNGIRMIGAGSLTVEDCTIQNVTQWGIQINNTGLAQLQFTRVTATNNSLGGVQIRPANSGAVAVGVITGLVSFKNGKGIEQDGNGGSTSLMNIRQSVFNSNGTGISLVTGATAVSALISDSSVQNSTTGITAAVNTIARVSGMDITGNTTGVSGNVSTFGNNRLRGNSTDGTMAALVPPGLQ
jgi:hypothetical protein